MLFLPSYKLPHTTHSTTKNDLGWHITKLWVVKPSSLEMCICNAFHSSRYRMVEIIMYSNTFKNQLPLIILNLTVWQLIIILRTAHTSSMPNQSQNVRGWGGWHKCTLNRPWDNVKEVQAVKQSKHFKIIVKISTCHASHWQPLNENLISSFLQVIFLHLCSLKLY